MDVAVRLLAQLVVRVPRCVRLARVVLIVLVVEVQMLLRCGALLWLFVVLVVVLFRFLSPRVNLASHLGIAMHIWLALVVYRCPRGLLLVVLVVLVCSRRLLIPLWRLSLLRRDSL